VSIDPTRLTALEMQQARHMGAAQALRQKAFALAAGALDTRKKAIAEASRRMNLPITAHSSLQEIAGVNAEILRLRTNPPLVDPAELDRAITDERRAAEIDALALAEERAARALDQLLTQCRKYAAARGVK
jgi:hypothetical protein